MDRNHGRRYTGAEGHVMTGETNREEFSLDAALAAERDAGEPALVVDVEGFEGPLDLLLALARQQKVDLAKISILALADQYLAFIEEARKLRLELAADYLVMAAWLAYLKSRLLLPDTNAPEGQSAEEMATALALRLRRLEAIREVAGQIFVRPQLDRDVFRRGQPEPIAHIKHPQWTATVYDLLSAYAQQRQRSALAHVRVAKRQVWSLAEAREALERLIGQTSDWARLDEYLISFVVEPSFAPTVFASSFASTLELVREGLMEVHQQAAFAPLYVRKRQQTANGAADRNGVAAPDDGKG
jgi:segregation and condensation protein A